MKGIIIYCDKSGNELERVSLLKLPVKKEKIKEESIRLYREEEPCIIYETTIINRIGIELLEELKEINKRLEVEDKIKNKLLTLDEVKKVTGDIFDFPEEVEMVRFV